MIKKIENILNHGYETPKQALETDSEARCGVLNPPLRGIVQLTNSAALRFRNWSFNNNFQKPTKLAVIFVAGALLLNLIYFNYHVIVAQYPHEYREGAMALATQQLLDHVNSYSLDEQPQHTNVYGALYNLTVYPFALIFGATLPLHRAVSAIFIILSCLWLIFIMRRNEVPLWLSVIGGIIYYSQITSFVSVIARPDSLGVFLFMSTIFLPWAGEFKPQYLWWSALCFVLSFYTKFYFIMSLPIVALYVFLFKDKVKAIFYFVFSVFLLLISTYFVNKYFPLYFTNTFYYYFNTADPFLDGFLLAVKYFAYFIYENLSLILLFLIYALEFIYINKSSFSKEFKDNFKAILISLKTLKNADIKFDYFLFIVLFTTLAFLLKLGHHKGGGIDYIHHLIAPFLIIIVFRFLAQKVLHNKFALYGILLILGMTFTFFNHRKATDYSNQWLDIERKLSGYKEIFNESAITSILLTQNKHIYNSGHSNEYIGTIMNKSPLYSKITRRVEVFENEINNKFINKEFDLVVLDDFTSDISRNMLNKYYRPNETMEAPMIINSWILELWEPRKDINNGNSISGEFLFKARGIHGAVRLITDKLIFSDGRIFSYRQGESATNDNSADLQPK